MFKKINIQFLISYFGLIPYAIVFLDKYYFINIKEETELDYAKKSTILNPYFMAFRNKALENEFLDLLRDFFKKLV